MVVNWEISHGQKELRRRVEILFPALLRITF